MKSGGLICLQICTGSAEVVTVSKFLNTGCTWNRRDGHDVGVELYGICGTDVNGEDKDVFFLGDFLLVETSETQVSSASARITRCDADST